MQASYIVPKFTPKSHTNMEYLISWKYCSNSQITDKTSRISTDVGTTGSSQSHHLLLHHHEYTIILWIPSVITVLQNTIWPLIVSFLWCHRMSCHNFSKRSRGWIWSVINPIRDPTMTRSQITRCFFDQVITVCQTVINFGIVLFKSL